MHKTVLHNILLSYIFSVSLRESGVFASNACACKPDFSSRAIDAARYPSLPARGAPIWGPLTLRAFDSSKMMPHHRRVPWFVPRPVRASEKPIITHTFTVSPVLAARQSLQVMHPESQGQTGRLIDISTSNTFSRSCAALIR